MNLNSTANDGTMNKNRRIRNVTTNNSKLLGQWFKGKNICKYTVTTEINNIMYAKNASIIIVLLTYAFSQHYLIIHKNM